MSTKVQPTKSSRNSGKPNVSRRKIFVDAFLNIENYSLSEIEKKRVKKEGLNNIQDGEFWFKVCKEYERLISCR